MWFLFTPTASTVRRGTIPQHPVWKTDTLPIELLTVVYCCHNYTTFGTFVPLQLCYFFESQARIELALIPWRGIVLPLNHKDLYGEQPPDLRIRTPLCRWYASFGPKARFELASSPLPTECSSERATKALFTTWGLFTVLDRARFVTSEASSPDEKAWSQR